MLAFIFVLGVLVFVHELGHFLAAKRVGIRVLKFQLGFNPTILSFRRGDTEYGIGALPLGGYVKMAGESPEDPRTGRDDEFLSKTKWQRFQVLIMGPVMNLLLAFVLTAVVLYRGAEVAGLRRSAAGRRRRRRRARPPSGPTSSPAIASSSVNDRPVNTWEDFFIAVGIETGSRDLDRVPARRPADDAQGHAGDGDGRTKPVRVRRDRRAAERASAPARRSTPASPATAAASRRAMSSWPSTDSR